MRSFSFLDTLRLKKSLLLLLLIAATCGSYAYSQTEGENAASTSVQEKSGGMFAKVNPATVRANQEKITELQRELRGLRKEQSASRANQQRFISTLLIIATGLFLYLILKIGIRKFESVISDADAIRESESVLRLKTITKLLHWVGSIVILFSILYMALKEFDVDVSPLLAGAGIAGLAFGFGGQYLIRDIINGIFILIEGQIRINDVVKIGDYAGLVEGVNLRLTTLRDMEGKVIFIPNGEIKTVQNFTKEFSRAVLSIGVAYKENVDRVMEVIKEIGKEMRADAYFGKLITQDLEMLGVDDFGESQVVIKFRMQTLPIKQWEVSRECRRRIKNKFDELGIEIPFPHRTLYWGTGEGNEWMRELADKAPTQNQ